MESLTDVAVFIQVVKSGSFTAAAERLELSKSVVSKYVSRLEDSLSARLLHRTTRRLSLTEVGRIFYERSRRGLDEIEAAHAEVSHLQSEPRGSLRLNVPMSFGILHIAPAIPDFLARFPKVSVDMRLNDRQVDVVAEGFDLAVRISELGDSSLVAKRIAPCKHVVCASPEYLKKHGTPQTPADLANHDIIAYRHQDSVHHWNFKSADGKKMSVNIKGGVRMNNSLALREVLLGGYGITRAPTFVVGAEIKSGRLQTVLSDFESLEISVYLVYPHRRHLSPKVRAFVDFMSERISRQPYWDVA